jgi:tRNA threonylcarbamoyladenosine modification (KEOPS) complex  Pcc1 subunit
VTRRRPPWSATVRLATGRGELARWLEQALSPEAAREVPRARTTLRRTPSGIELRVEASDAGAMRAALNTYLGWVALSLATVGAAGGGQGPRSRGRPPAEALISRSR